MISTGFTSLDDLLSGGWHLGEIIEITGVRGSGKTLLVLYSLVLHLLLNPTHYAIYIDTQSSFDAQRCHSIAQVVIANLRAQGGSFLTIDGEEEIGWEEVSTEALTRISVTKCFSAEVVLNTLNSSPKPSDVKRDTIVVIDSVTTLFPGDFTSSTEVAQGTFQSEPFLLKIHGVRNLRDFFHTSAQSNIITFMRGLINLSRSPESPLTIFVSQSTSTFLKSRTNLILLGPAFKQRHSHKH